MVIANHPQSEPTPEFNQRCMNTLTAWERGELPYKEAVALFSQYKLEAERSGHIANQARAEHMLGYIQHYRGNLNTSIQHYERARTLYKAIGNQTRVAAIDLNQGENHRFKGNFSRALREYRACYDVAERLGNVMLQCMAALNEGLVLVTLGQNQEALHAFEVTLQLTTQWPGESDKLNEVFCELYHGLSVVHLRIGDLETAWEAALHAMEAAAKTQQPLHLGFANRTLAEVLTSLGTSPEPRFSSDPDIYFRAALDAFRELNAEAEVARTLFAQALSLATRGRRTTAGRMLQEVMIIFSNLEMVDDANRAAEAQRAVL
ncbi:MAG: hypothetical protein OHK0046_13810 [Anaerolineae bacterium]